MKRLWHRLLAWGFRKRRDAWIRVELVGSFDGPVERIVEHRGCVFVLTRHNVYSITHDYVYPSVRRIA